MVVIVDTRVAPVLSAALGNGSPGASVFATAADIAVALAQDGSVGTDDLIWIAAVRAAIEASLHLQDR